MEADCYCDFDPPEFFSEKVVRARKTHHCDECLFRILPGEEYYSASGKWDGFVRTFRRCEHCHNISQWLRNNLPCFCDSFGGLYEVAEEAIDDAYYRAREEVIGLRFGYLRRFSIARRARLERVKEMRDA